MDNCLYRDVICFSIAAFQVGLTPVATADADEYYAPVANSPASPLSHQRQLREKKENL